MKLFPQLKISFLTVFTFSDFVPYSKMASHLFGYRVGHSEKVPGNPMVTNALHIPLFLPVDRTVEVHFHCFQGRWLYED